MKLKMFIAAGLLVYAVFSTGCATIMKGSESDVFFVNGPNDLEVYDETGKQLALDYQEANELYSFSDSYGDEMNSTRTTYYAYGYTFPDATKTYNLTLKSSTMGETQVKLEPEMAMRWFWLDLFTGGIIVDAITGNWNELSEEDGEMNQVDVYKHFNNVSKHSTGN